MRPVRHNDYSPRVEMLPLIDVIFLLLTFFIYSLIIMVRAEVLPIELTGVPAGEQVEAGTIEAVTIDAEGQVYLNREPTTLADLRGRFEEFAGRANQPRVYVAIGEEAQRDRSPLLLELIGMAQATGLRNFGVVGPKGAKGAKKAKKAKGGTDAVNREALP